MFFLNASRLSGWYIYKPAANVVSLKKAGNDEE